MFAGEGTKSNGNRDVAELPLIQSLERLIIRSFSPPISLQKNGHLKKNEKVNIIERKSFRSYTKIIIIIKCKLINYYKKCMHQLSVVHCNFASFSVKQKML